MRSKSVLVAGDTIAVRVSRYAPGEHQRMHTDALSRISILLEGEYLEDGRTGSVRMQPGNVLLKSRRAEHEDTFGAQGARIASLEFRDDDPFDDLCTSEHWRSRSDPSSLRYAIAILEASAAGDAVSARTAADDLVTDGVVEVAGARNAPAWLKLLKDELETHGLARVNVAARASKEGAHPAHASRLFRRCFGTSITDHAQGHNVRRATVFLASAMSLSEVALAAGFYDQSHMNRVFRRILGRSPGAIRALFATAR